MLTSTTVVYQSQILKGSRLHEAALENRTTFCEAGEADFVVYEHEGSLISNRGCDWLVLQVGKEQKPATQ